MAKDGVIPLSPGRKTRSSSHLSPSKPSPQNVCPFSSQTQSQELIHCLYSSEEPISLATLISSLPGRKPQILEILRLVGSLNSPMFPLLIYGGPSNGKTISILQIFRYLNRPFVYAGFRTCYSPRILFDSVLRQLLLHGRNPIKGNSGTKRCEKPSEFIDLLRTALVQAINALRERNLKSGPEEVDRGEMIYLIFDNFELLRSWDKNSNIVPLLLRIHEILKIPEVGIIYISSSTPDAHYLCTGSIEPITIYFPDYSLEDLHGIFMRNQPNPKLYSSFLSVVLKPFFRVTRRVDELSVAFQPLFQKYCKPLVDQSVVPDEAMKRKLFDNLQPYLTVSLNDLFLVLSRSSHQIEQEGDRQKKGIRKSNRKEVSNELDFHMSMSAKYLLLSAFIASRNPATLDASLFDSSGGLTNRKRNKNSQMSMDRKDRMAEEILLKGPGSFPLERLLAIFQCITSVAESMVEEEQCENGTAIESESVGLTSDVLLQLSALCNANFICKNGSCPLEGSTRYRCTIDEEMAVRVAKSINFPLSSYLYRR
ncbi:hypothetical protein IEQ34_004207 [Dendrobium chrysotoxum]|uniref:Origin of replication complex subunit 5 n=1 Tax=Dendrobium chrysotoxum TaxID=161865 RepID=A0AAV7HGN8_DENCH|nr:hypothetical protein IEQ34_004207 [Dendrobium chrysotoxum]